MWLQSWATKQYRGDLTVRVTTLLNNNNRNITISSVRHLFLNCQSHCPLTENWWQKSSSNLKELKRWKVRGQIHPHTVRKFIAFLDPRCKQGITWLPQDIIWCSSKEAEKSFRSSHVSALELPCFLLKFLCLLHQCLHLLCQTGTHRFWHYWIHSLSS